MSTVMSFAAALFILLFLQFHFLSTHTGYSSFKEAFAIFSVDLTVCIVVLFYRRPT
jgi:hypothetical protein